MRVLLQTVFTPGAPVGKKELLAGRIDEINQVISAVSQRGQHAIVFGERGVGKTSLAGLIHQIWSDVAKDIEYVIPPRINCDTADDFRSIWAKVADEIMLIFEKRSVDWKALPENGAFQTALAELDVGNATPALVRRALDLSKYRFIVVIDEFDRLEDREAARMIADTIKMLSDHLVDATLILVGVADTVDGLIEEHASIDRSLVQVLVPRMTPNELKQIIHNGLGVVDMTIDPVALERIARLSQGLPNYTHLLGLTSAVEAVKNGRKNIEMADVTAGTHRALDTVQESIRNAYYEATVSSHKDSLYKQVLLACALTNVDELGYFAPAAVRQPMSAIMGKHYDIPSFMRHLRDFCSDKRQRILQRSGEQTRPRYRFRNPLMQPYVLLRGIQDNPLPESLLRQLSDSS
jgi:Cdc6-like AAA superfamily ATPase